MFRWNNRNRLRTLKVGGGGDVLVLEAGVEKARIYIRNRDIEKVVCFFRGSAVGTIRKNQRYHLSVGNGNIKRNVYHYLKPDGPLPTLRLGITKHCGNGTWSSLPHDFELDTEAGFEEAFFYLLKGATGRAVQVGRGVWCDNDPVDQVWPVRDRSWSTIPMGYHPVVAEPGVHVSYIWAYLAKKKKWEKI